MRVIALTLLLVGLIGAPAAGQGSDGLAENQKAVLVFDVRMDMLNSSKLGKKMKFAENMTKMNEQSGQEGPDPAKLERIFGAMSAPKNLAEAQSIQGGGGPLPFEFFARAKYKDAESAKLALDSTLDGTEEKIEKDGRTLYKVAAGGDVPEGLLMHMVDETTVEVGTEAYIYHKDRNVFTDNLKASWGKAPDEGIRIAMDLAGAKELVADLVAQGKANAPDPTVEPFLDLVDNIKDMGLSMDLKQKNLLTLRANAIDTENAEELKGGLDSLLFMAKAGGKQGLMMLQGAGEDGKDIAKVFGKILDSMKAKQSGTDVSVIIPRPNGFENAVEKASMVLPMMMMGGMGGPGGPPGGGFDGPGGGPGGRPPGGPGGPPPGQDRGGLTPPPLGQPGKGS